MKKYELRRLYDELCEDVENMDVVEIAAGDTVTFSADEVPVQLVYKMREVEETVEDGNEDPLADFMETAANRIRHIEGIMMVLVTILRQKDVLTSEERTDLWRRLLESRKMSPFVGDASIDDVPSDG